MFNPIELLSNKDKGEWPNKQLGLLTVTED